MTEEMRLSKLITTFGPGSILTLSGGGSVMIMSPHFWHNRERIYEPRLQDRLNIDHLCNPDESYDNVNQMELGIAVRRFPRLQVCPDCYLLTNRVYCPECAQDGKKIKTRPPRLVAACEDGHIQDFPWKIWAHCECDRDEKKLRLEPITGSGSRNSDLKVRCENCGNEDDLRGSLGPIKVGEDKYLTCLGKRPWLGLDEEDCDNPLKGVMRGASNVYFPDIESVLSLPPFTNKIFRLIEKHMESIRTFRQNDSLSKDVLKGLFQRYIEEGPFTVKDFEEAIDEYFGYESPPQLKYEEWRVLIDPGDYGTKDYFQSQEVDIGESLRRYFDQIVRVDKLKEVLALKGFYRIRPGDSGRESADIMISDWDSKKRQVDFRPVPEREEELSWLPGVEHLGEGIFFRFNEERLSRWEDDSGVKERVDRIVKQADDYLSESMDLTERSLLIHSFSHQILKQIALDCGYPIASLKERLYISESDDDHPMGGVLIYTSSPDSEGTLGGLISQAKDEILTRKIERLKKKVLRCSQDPLCESHDPTKTNNPWGASCHSCLQLPETSCEGVQNKLLDRLIVSSRESDVGYFDGYFD